VDPRHVVQMQLQMHATGAPVAFLCSWARSGMHMWLVPYRPAFVLAAAAVLKCVLERYVYAAAPPPTGDVFSCDKALKDPWLKMWEQLREVMGAIQRLSIESALSIINMKNTIAGAERHSVMKRARPYLDVL
jgi:hypothetical protein